MHTLSDTITLNNGYPIPRLGLGVFQIPKQTTAEVVKNTIVTGYHAIDTAAIYDNEVETGLGIQQGLQATSLTRQDLFVTSKLWNDHLSYDETIAAANDSLKRLSLDYLDLYLIHWPGDNAFKDAWLALEDLYAAGKIKAIGVSNFQIHHLTYLLSFAKVLPVINQIELHPKLSQVPLREFCAANNIKIQAWAPLMQGQLLTNPVVLTIAAKYHKSAAQVILRWAIQQDILLNVKSVQLTRMTVNRDVFDFELSSTDMTQLNALNENKRVGPDPDTFNFQ